MILELTDDEAFTLDEALAVAAELCSSPFSEECQAIHRKLNALDWRRPQFIPMVDGEGITLTPPRAADGGGA